MRDYILTYFYDTIKTMKRETKFSFLLLLLIIISFLWVPLVQAQKKVILGKVEGIINPVIEQFVVRLIEEGKRRSKVILILLDTPEVRGIHA